MRIIISTITGLWIFLGYVFYMTNRLNEFKYRFYSMIKGGYFVDIKGVKAFLPGSQVDLRPIKDMFSLIGKVYDFKILSADRSKNNIVVSRRAILEAEREGKRREALDSMEEGQLVKGIVKNITNYGAFLDVGGIDGLLHITDLSWGRVNHPSEMLSVGDELDVKVLKFDREKVRLTLGLKQTTPDPWSIALDNYPVGTKVVGKVVRGERTYFPELSLWGEGD